MKTPRLLWLIISFLIFMALMTPPAKAQSLQDTLTENRSGPLKQQNGNAITAVGQMCGDVGCDISPFTFEFNPSGGAIGGHFEFEATEVTGDGSILNYRAVGDQSGYFEGGDGGKISGTLLVNAPGSSAGTVSIYWEGNLYADGTGKGVSSAEIFDKSGSWSVTFDAVVFQAYLGLVEIPTGVSVPVNAVELTQEARDFIARSPTLSDATKAVLNQDSVILARDMNNHFYAINNRGQAIPIPAQLNKKFDMSNEFTLLHNKQVLKGVIDKMGHGPDDGSINGGANAATLAKIPDDLKDHDYGTLSTECSSAGCVTQFKMNSTATSIHISDAAILGTDWRKYATGGSELGSIRGTINGGGDFIYEPGIRNQLALISLAKPLPDANNPGYLGVLAQDGADGAVISMIQSTSPAEQAGLAIGDKVVSVSGVAVDAEHTLGTLTSQNAGGAQVDLGIERNGSLQTIPVTLARLLPSQIITPSAEITVGDHTELVVDIGFNGVTGVLVLSDWAQVRESITGSQVNVPAGSAVIVVSGYEIGNPIQVAGDQINSWWEGEAPSTPPLNVEPIVNPVINTNWIFGLGSLGVCGAGVLLIGLVIVFSRRRAASVTQQLLRPPAAKPPPPETLNLRKDTRKPPPPEKLK